MKWVSREVGYCIFDDTDEVTEYDDNSLDYEIIMKTNRLYYEYIDKYSRK